MVTQFTVSTTDLYDGSRLTDTTDIMWCGREVWFTKISLSGVYDRLSFSNVL